MRYAAVIVDGHAAGRCGLGAVMGAKNLKAIAVRGTRGLTIADPAAFMRAVWAMRKKLAEYYEGPGAEDPIEIRINRGTYIPEFIERHGRDAVLDRICGYLMTGAPLRPARPTRTGGDSAEISAILAHARALAGAS